jgi:hypothetical protein
MSKHRGPRTTDVERAWAAYHEAIAGFGPGSTAKELKAASNLAKAAFRLSEERRLAEQASAKSIAARPENSGR